MVKNNWKKLEKQEKKLFFPHLEAFLSQTVFYLKCKIARHFPIYEKNILGENIHNLYFLKQYICSTQSRIREKGSASSSTLP